MVVSRKTGHYRNAVLVPAANHRRQLIPTVRYPQLPVRIMDQSSGGVSRVRVEPGFKFPTGRFDSPPYMQYKSLIVID